MVRNLWAHDLGWDSICVGSIDWGYVISFHQSLTVKCNGNRRYDIKIRKEEYAYPWYVYGRIVSE